MMSAKLATLWPLKIIFQNKGHYVIITSMTSPAKKISRDSNYNVDVVMLPKFDNFSVPVREVTITSIL